MGTPRPLVKVDAYHRASRLEAALAANRVLRHTNDRLLREVESQRAQRIAADRNAARFHALMLQARVRLAACEKRAVT